ncbi:keratin-associated protein 19-2-like [Pecten maximus]|uniref:keratin-associated protein 19-2-like n=1 Tax=Pecten maximus TaxID=6579 RepID=UPI001458142B|nr:keratin-associated protein 19-2-like [Pecten maximus]
MLRDTRLVDENTVTFNNGVLTAAKFADKKDVYFLTTSHDASYPWYGGWNDDGWGWGSDDGGYYQSGFGGMVGGMNMPGMMPYMGMGMGYGGYNNWGYNSPMPYGRWGCGGWWGGDDNCGFDG